MSKNLVELIIEDEHHITGRGMVLTASRVTNNLETTKGLIGKDLIYKDKTYTITNIEEFRKLFGNPPLMGEIFGIQVREKVMEEKDNIETERRFLLKALPNAEYDKILVIIQTYVTEKGVDKIKRVRDVSNMEGEKERMFYVTTKTRISDMSCIEDERELSHREYRQILDDSDVQRVIPKTRYKKDVGELTWEIDVFNKMIIAEVELPNEEYDLTIPEWLEDYVLLEVTGMEQFSNSNLAE